MRAAVNARSVPCRPVRICLHLLLKNIVILNEINGDREYETHRRFAADSHETRTLDVVVVVSYQ